MNFFPLSKNPEIKLATLLPMAVICERYFEASEAVSEGSDYAAEIAFETAAFGDGPCGSAKFMQEHRAWIGKLNFWQEVFYTAKLIGPFAPVVPDDCPF